MATKIGSLIMKLTLTRQPSQNYKLASLKQLAIKLAIKAIFFLFLDIYTVIFLRSELRGLETDNLVLSGGNCSHLPTRDGNFKSFLYSSTCMK